MNFKDLEAIISYIEDTVECPNCSGHFHKEDINIAGSTNQESLLYVHCPWCSANVGISVSLTEDKTIQATRIPKQAINRSHRSIKRIEKKDIVKARDFLNNFDGDFKKLFSKK